MSGPSRPQTEYWGEGDQGSRWLSWKVRFLMLWNRARRRAYLLAAILWQFLVELAVLLGTLALVTFAVASIMVLGSGGEFSYGRIVGIVGAWVFGIALFRLAWHLGGSTRL